MAKLKLGELYKRWTLDCIVDLAYAVSRDFSNRPEFYQKIKSADKLTELQGNYGFNPSFPGKDIRSSLMLPIFGESDGTGSRNDGSQSQTYRLPVLTAAADFSENAQPTGFPMLRERIRSSIVPFKTHMVDLVGASLDQTTERMQNIFDISQVILKDPGVFGVFGINNIDPKSPLESYDPQFAKLIQNITSQLPDMPHGIISREQFVRMQRIGDKGGESITMILEKDIENDDKLLEQLIAQLYAWGSDLGLVGGATPTIQ